MEIKIGDVKIECVKGDITEQKGIDAVVNAANAHLAPGGGVAGAIHRKAGPQLYQECKKYAPIKTGQAVITKGYNLPNPYVIHTLGPVYSEEENPAEKLSLCFKNSLKIADEKGLKSIAFPAISTGIFGYPMEEAAEVSIKTVIEEAKNLKSVKLIRFVLYDEKGYTVFKSTLERFSKEK